VERVHRSVTGFGDRTTENPSVSLSVVRRLYSVAWLQAAPIAVIMAFFLVVPIAVIVVVSFWDYTEYDIVPDFLLTNYIEVFGSAVTYATYFSTLRFAALTWFFTLLIGFWIAYFLVFHVRSKTWQTTLFMICTLPFLTSNVIRSIAWIPVLGRNGLVYSGLIHLGVVDHPLEFLLFSDFSVVLSYVHLFVLFMVVPIFNTMMRIDKSLIEAAVDAGASGWQVVRDIVIPLSKPGIAIGSIFVVTLVMGEFITVRLMSGGQSASVGMMISNQLNYLQYPAAAANAVVLLGVVLLIVAAMMRVVDIRKEL
jgi:putative spermidine/putrescine transport system permease protein